MRDRPVATEKISVLTAVRRGASLEAKRRAIVRRRRGPSAISSPWPTSSHRSSGTTAQQRERFENRHYTSQIKTYFRRLETAVTAGDDAQITAEHRKLVSLIDKAVKRGALHANTGARKKSRAERMRRGVPVA